MTEQLASNSKIYGEEVMVARWSGFQLSEHDMYYPSTTLLGVFHGPDPERFFSSLDAEHKETTQIDGKWTEVDTVPERNPQFDTRGDSFDVTPAQ